MFNNSIYRKFSIIIPFFNSENFLKDSIESIINQTLNFEDNVELILVNDGSEDTSENIAIKYKERYPNNIVLLSQEHKGQASAKNLALDYSNGEYVGFLDSDDYLSKNCLMEVLNFFEENSFDLNLVAIPIYYFGRFNKSHELNTLFVNDTIIDLDKNPEYFLISCCNCFIKSDSLDNFKFNENLSFFDSAHFILTFLNFNNNFGVLNSAKYYYRKRTDLFALSDNKKFNKEYFLNTLNHFHLNIINYFDSINEDLPKYMQYAFIYSLLRFIEDYEKDILNCSQVDHVFKDLHKIFRNIDKDVINNIDIDEKLRLYFYYLKYGNVNFTFEGDELKLQIDEFKVNASYFHNLLIDNIYFDGGYVFLSGLFDSYFNDEYISIGAVVSFDDEKEFIENIELDICKNRKFINSFCPFRYNFSFKIPFKKVFDFDIKLFLTYFKDNCDGGIKFTRLFNKLNINLDNKINLMTENLTKDFEVLFNDNSITVQRFFKFSIIMAIYNTEEYLSESIDCVISQSLDFQENVQLILVDDGSEDRSKEIALSYQEKYPNNILVLSKENGGQASARNLGIDHAKGRYLNFLDSDDYFSENTLSDVLKFFSRYQDVDVVAIPMTYFGRKTHEHILNSKFANPRVIDLKEEPNNPLLSCSSSFFRKSALGDYRFNTQMANLEDALLVNKILLNNMRYGAINSSKYYYRKRFDESSTTDNVVINPENFTNRLKQFHLNLIYQSISIYGEVKDFIQYLLIYDLQWMLDAPQLDLDDIHTEEFWYYFNKVLGYILPEYIVNNKYIENYKELFLYYLKVKDYKIEFHPNNVIMSVNNHQLDNLEFHQFWLDIVEIDAGFLNISGFLNSHFDSKSISIEAIKEYPSGVCERFVGKYIHYSTSRKNIDYLNIPWGYKYSFDIRIPLSNLKSFNVKLRVNYHKDNDNNNFNSKNLISSYLSIGFLNHTKLSEFSNYSVYGNWIVKFVDNNFEVKQYSNNEIIKNELIIQKKLFNKFKVSKQFIFIKLLMLRLIYFTIMILRLKRKPIYLFMDRIDNADDNAETLFKHAMAINDNIKKYFVLDNNSLDFNRVSKFGCVLKYKSNKHRLIYLIADKIIVTHPDGYIVNPFFNMDENKYIGGLNNSKLYFLQHGVTWNNVSFWLHKYDMNLKLVVAVSDEERQSFINDDYGYDETVVQTLGFPRFDNLKNDTKKQILLMPTWRRYLEGNKETFIKSDYFKRLNSFLSNENFINLCKNAGYDIILKPHPRLNEIINGTDEKYIDLLNINENIILSEDSYQNLFNSSSLLITDYSSVHFDFAYLKKPIIYYQPDDDHHHDKDYFDLKEMGFGDIIKSEDFLINKIETYLSNGCKMEYWYKQRVENFFKYIDQNNSKRTYEWIKKH